MHMRVLSGLGGWVVGSPEQWTHPPLIEILVLAGEPVRRVTMGCCNVRGVLMGCCNSYLPPLVRIFVRAVGLMQRACVVHLLVCVACGAWVACGDS